MIPATTLAAGNPGTSTVKYNVQSVVKPGDQVPTSLKCARDCPSYALLNAANISEVYTTGTKQKGGGTASAAVVTYTWDSSAYTLSEGGGSLSNDLLTGKTLPTQYTGGIRSGALVDATGNKWNSGGSMEIGRAHV